MSDLEKRAGDMLLKATDLILSKPEKLQEAFQVAIKTLTAERRLMLEKCEKVVRTPGRLNEGVMEEIAAEIRAIGEKEDGR